MRWARCCWRAPCFFYGFDTSFVAFYGAIVGILLLAAAVFFTFQARPKRALLAALGVMLLAFFLLEARDYVFVKYYRASAAV